MIYILIGVFFLGQKAQAYGMESNIFHTGMDEYTYASWGADVLNSNDMCERLLQKYGDVSKLPEITVGVIDSGIDYNHEFFDGRIKSYQYDYVDDDGDAMDENGHGTHVAGIIVDITLPNVKLNAYRVANRKGEAYFDAIVSAIEQAIQDNVDIINISLGAELPSESREEKMLREALEQAIDKDIVVVVAAGNGNAYREGIDVGNVWPACYPNVVTVSAIGQDYVIASFSNYGKVIDLCAPGVDINSTYLDNEFFKMSGTSMACPFVSGAAALLLTDDPTMSHSQVVEGLKSIAIDLGEPGVDTYYGYGLVNLKNWQMHENTSELKTESIQILPGKVSVTKLTNVSNGIKIKWKKASNTQGYYIYRKSSSTGYKKIKTIKNPKATTYIDKNTKIGKSYRYKVIPYYKDAVGTCSKTMKLTRRKTK